MYKKIGIASTKGGVGRTTTAVSLGHALHAFGREIIVVEGDLHKPHVGALLGYEHTPASIHHVLDGDIHISQATYIHPSGLRIIPGNMHHETTDYAIEHFFDLLSDLHNRAEVVLIDLPPSPKRLVKDFFKQVDCIIIVTTPDRLSLTEAKKTISLAREGGTPLLGLVVNSATKDTDVTKIEQELGVSVIGLIPTSQDIIDAHEHKHPVTYTHTESKATRAYNKLAANLIGDKYVQNLEKEEKNFRDIFRRMGLK